MEYNITLHTYKTEAIKNLASDIIKEDIIKELDFMIDEDDLNERLTKVLDKFFADHSPKEIAKMMVGLTYSKHVKFVHFEEDEFVEVLAKYIMMNFFDIMNRVRSEARYACIW